MPGSGGGAKSKGAPYRETLQTTGFYVGRIVIVPGEFAPIPSPPLRRRALREHNSFPECVSQGRRNLSLRWSLQTWGWGAASRWSAPSPGKRTRREDHVPSHRPQMSSDRLFLDRVARQHCPSPLHRHAHTTTHPLPARPKQDISTLQRIGHFYFALTSEAQGPGKQGIG